MSTDKIFETEAQVLKVDSTLGLVFGYAMVCKINGEDHYDLQGDHIPEATMLKALTEFAIAGTVAKEMHTGEAIGKFVHTFPMTTDIAKSLGIEVKQTGALVAMKPESKEVLAKFVDGTYTGFSIGGINPVYEVVND